MSDYEFYGLVEHNPRSRTVIVGVHTKRFGIYQARTDGDEVIPGTESEPNQRMFTDPQWKTIEKYAHLEDSRLITERFD